MKSNKKVNPRRRPASRADVERAKRTAVSLAISQTQAIVLLTCEEAEAALKGEANETDPV